jgi:hypothetical protein
MGEVVWRGASRKKPQSVCHEVCVKISAAVVVLVVSGSVADAASVPLPRPRPAGVGQTAPAPQARPAAVPDAKGAAANKPDGEAKGQEAAAKPSACQLSLASLAAFTPQPPVKGAGECGIADPVRLEAVILADQTHVVINPPAVLRCEMAAAVATWIREGIAPVAARLGSALRGIENYDSYDCRGRNRVLGAKMSEHGRGNALDIKGMKLASGVIAHLTDPHVAKAVRDDLRAGACSRFMTVLGPGSDGYHENHIHVDLAERKSDYRLCQWEVRQPLEHAAPSPHIASSRAPTPLESMPSETAAPVNGATDATPLPPARRAAERR